jgi:hypothetical protein
MLLIAASEFERTMSAALRRDIHSIGVTGSSKSPILANSACEKAHE